MNTDFISKISRQQSESNSPTAPCSRLPTGSTLSWTMIGEFDRLVNSKITKNYPNMFWSLSFSVGWEMMRNIPVFFQVRKFWKCFSQVISGRSRKNVKPCGQMNFSWGHSFVENFKLILMSYLWQRKNDVTASYDVTKYGSTEKREIVQKRYFAPISAPIELKTSYYMYFGMRNPFLMFIWV